jgi:tRNA nucleotidyltransferase (CCA-adding enzyme)
MAGLLEVKPSGWVNRLDGIPALALYAVYLASEEGPARDALLAYVARWSRVTPLTSGHDLRLRGIPPGPAYKRILGRLREAWLDGEITSPAQEDAELTRMIAEAQRR